MPKTIKLRFSLSGTYEVTLDQGALNAYGTLDPEEIAKIDTEVIQGDPFEFLEEVTEAKVEVIDV
jgi:hypothetical protein